MQRGGFYDGDITAVTVSSARVSVTPQLSIEPSLSINDVDLPYGDFTNTAASGPDRLSRFRPRMFASGLFQYNSTDNSFSSNLRFRWEYHPGSELFVVYTDERDTAGAGLSGAEEPRVRGQDHPLVADLNATDGSRDRLVCQGPGKLRFLTALASGSRSSHSGALVALPSSGSTTRE